MTYSTLFKRNQIIIFSCLLSHPNYQFIEKNVESKIYTHALLKRAYSNNFQLQTFGWQEPYIHIYTIAGSYANVLNFLYTWYMTSIKIYILLSLAICFIFHFFSLTAYITWQKIEKYIYIYIHCLLYFKVREWSNSIKFREQ